MATNVLILGRSGTGKSRSILNLDPKTTFIINVNKKPLPFRGWKKKFVEATKENPNGNIIGIDDPDLIINTIRCVDNSRSEIKTLIIDDAQYIMANEFMRRAMEKGYDKFTQIAEHFWKIIWECQLCREDMICIFLSHSEIDENGLSKAKTIGKLLNEKIDIEGMFTIVLNTIVEDGKYSFGTQNDGSNTSKSPEGMFQPRIENDLKTVIDSINSYNEGE